jgi:hypothetical protein
MKALLNDEIPTLEVPCAAVNATFIKVLLLQLQNELLVTAFQDTAKHHLIATDLSSKVHTLTTTAALDAGFTLDFAAVLSTKAATTRCIEIFQIVMQGADGNVKYVIPVFLRGDQSCTLTSEMCVPAWLVKQVDDAEASMSLMFQKFTFELPEGAVDVVAPELREQLPKQVLLRLPRLLLKPAFVGQLALQLTRGPFQGESAKKKSKGLSAPFDLMQLLGADALKATLATTPGDGGDTPRPPAAKRAKLAGAGHLLR